MDHRNINIDSIQHSMGDFNAMFVWGWSCSALDKLIISTAEYCCDHPGSHSCGVRWLIHKASWGHHNHWPKLLPLMLPLCVLMGPDGTWSKVVHEPVSEPKCTQPHAPEHPDTNADKLLENDMWYRYNIYIYIYIHIYIWHYDIWHMLYIYIYTYIYIYIYRERDIHMCCVVHMRW